MCPCIQRCLKSEPGMWGWGVHGERRTKLKTTWYNHSDLVSSGRTWLGYPEAKHVMDSRCGVVSWSGSVEMIWTKYPCAIPDPHTRSLGDWYTEESIRKKGHCLLPDSIWCWNHSGASYPWEAEMNLLSHKALLAPLLQVVIHRQISVAFVIAPFTRAKCLDTGPWDPCKLWGDLQKEAQRAL